MSVLRSLGALVGSVATGAAAGAVGTVAMDALGYSRYRRGGGTTKPMRWEFGGVSGWSDVSAPGQVGELALRTALGHTPPDSWAEPTQNIVHWSTGIGWGAAYGAAHAIRPGSWWATGPLLGLAAWATSYVVLPQLKIYKPMWDYSGETLAKDLGTHLVYGTTTALAYRLVSRT